MTPSNNDPMRLPLALQDLFQVCRDKDIPLYLAAEWFSRASRVGAEQTATDVYENAAREQCLNLNEPIREALAAHRAAELRDAIDLFPSISGSRRCP